VNFDIKDLIYRYRSKKPRYRSTSIYKPEIEGLTFDIEVSSISKGFLSPLISKQILRYRRLSIRYRSKYFDIEGFDIEVTFDIGGGKPEVPDDIYISIYTIYTYISCTYMFIYFQNCMYMSQAIRFTKSTSMYMSQPCM
jgi:hypothetical protein